MEALTWTDPTSELVPKHSSVTIEVNVVDEEGVWSRREGESINANIPYVTCEKVHKIVTHCYK